LAMTSKVTVPRGVLIALAAAAALGFVGIVFLLGRESARPAPAPVLVPAAAGQAPPEAAPLPAPDPGLPAVPAALAPIPAYAAPGLPGAPRNDGDRAAVQAYFRALDGLQPDVKGEPDQVAQEVMAGFAKGDTARFDGMDRQAQTARNRMAALTPPAPCAAFHQESLAVMEADLDLMRGIRQAMAATDGSTALGALTEKANALKARTEALKARETALRAQYR